MSTDLENLSNPNKVNFANPRGFGTTFKADIREALFPDDPFHGFGKENALGKVKKGLNYFVPIFSWLPKYTLQHLFGDVLAGLTITSLAIPQGISYAKLAEIPPVIGLYTSFVPPLIYAILGHSNYLAVGNVAACSLLIREIVGEAASPDQNPTLYLHLVFTATFVTGAIQAIMGVLRLGILVDFLAHSTIVGFMGGTAILITLQQLKGILGLKTLYTTRTDVISVLTAVFKLRKQWQWQTAVAGIVFLTFLQATKYIKDKKPKLFYVPAMAPLFVVIVGCLYSYFGDADANGIPTVGELKKGISPLSIQHLNFDMKYLPAVLKAGTITGLIALAEGIAIGRSFAAIKNEQVDGNKEMIAYGMMNIIGSFFSCYLSTGPFSKTAVNVSAGARTPMANAVMSVFMLLVLLVLAPFFGHTPLVALSAIIVSAMLGLIKYDVAIELFKVDKFDFAVCMTAFCGVAFISMDKGLALSVTLNLVRALLYVARPGTCKLGKLPEVSLYRDLEQYPDGIKHSGILVLQIGSPIYYANANYIRERILRWIRDEQYNSSESRVEHVLLDLSGVITIDMSGIESLGEIFKTLRGMGIKLGLVNPRIKVMEKMIASHLLGKIGKENVFLSVEDAVQSRRFSFDVVTDETSASSTQTSEAVQD